MTGVLGLGPEGQVLTSLTAASRSVRYPGLGVDVRAVAEQDSDDVGLVGAGGEVERRFTARRLVVWVGAGLQQEHGDVHVAHERRHVQRRQARLQPARQHRRGETSGQKYNLKTSKKTLKQQPPPFYGHFTAF